MWIAKNSITGKEYGKQFECAIDCQVFIDQNLKLLEYEFQRVFSLENEILDEIEISQKGLSLCGEFNLRMNKCIHDMFDGDFKEKIKIMAEEAFKKGHSKRTMDEALTKYAKTNWLKNNIIRCWNTDQNRFADGFDF